MRKEYRPTYLSSLILLCVEIAFTMIPSAFVLGFIISRDGRYGIIEVALMVVGAMLANALFFTLLALIVNLIAKPISKKRAVLADRYIEYGGARLPLREITHVSLFLPETGRNNHDPQCLSLYIDDKRHIVIKRPALSLIRDVRRACPGAKFRIENLGEKIKFCSIVGIVCAVLLPIVILIEK